VEVTSTCNFRCLMCPTGNLSLERRAEFMNESTWVKIIDSAVEGGIKGIRFIGWGEPTLHPKLLSYIRECHSHGILTHLNTNGSQITPGYSTQLILAGLSSIKFSFQGIDRGGFRKMRNTDFFDGQIAAIKTMVCAREEIPYMYISVSTTTTRETPAEIKRFVHKMEKMGVDKVSAGNTIFDFLDIDKSKLSDNEKQRLRIAAEGEAPGHKNHPDPCPEVFDKLSIHADGSGAICCNDVNGLVDIGNINTDGLDQIFAHPRMQEYRMRLAQKNYDAPLCETCFDYQNTTGVQA